MPPRVALCLLATGVLFLSAGCGPDAFHLASGGGTAEALAAPVFSIPAGTYATLQTVVILEPTVGAAIYYTTNGATPTAGSTLYTGPVTVASTETLEAVAVEAGHPDSAVTMAAYTIAPPNLPVASAPVFTPAAGSYSAAQSVTITDGTPGAAIYYTTNGTAPTPASTLYTGPILVGSTETLEAVATVPGYQTSAVATAAYTIAPLPLPMTAAPAFAPPAGSYTTAQSVTITDSTAGASIYYTTNGTTPTITSTLYTGPIAVASTETLEAIALAPNHVDSAVVSAAYTIGAPAPAENDWTWMSGGSGGGAAISYGTLGVAAASNTPGARYVTTNWTDTSGNFWLFGGVVLDATGNFGGYKGDLWEFQPATNAWTWTGGSQAANSTGVYGTLGVASAQNMPPARTTAQTWVDLSGNLWMFGGSTQSTASVELDDLWRYNPSTAQWTWMGGTTTFGHNGSYGTMGVASPSNTPSARANAVTFTDKSGKFWMFGGSNQEPNFGNVGYFNDLWEFDPNTLEWTWISGSNQYFQPGTYGTLGTFAAANVPGARIRPTAWTDQNGNFWLFGGLGFDSSSSNQGYMELNDLWEFNPALGQWAWMSGSSVRNALGVYGTKGVPAAGNVPGSRDAGVSWVDRNGNLWLFGGVAMDPLRGVPQVANDLWRYQIAANQWTWMAGNSENDNSGIYGTLGVPNALNTPGAREGMAAWTDTSGNLWLFGGFGEAANTGGTLGDLWRYQP